MVSCLVTVAMFFCTHAAQPLVAVRTQTVCRPLLFACRASLEPQKKEKSHRNFFLKSHATQGTAQELVEMSELRQT